RRPAPAGRGRVRRRRRRLRAGPRRAGGGGGRAGGGVAAGGDPGPGRALGAAAARSGGGAARGRAAGQRRLRPLRPPRRRLGGWGREVFGPAGGPARRLGPAAGLVAATRRFESPPVWLVTGATAAGVRAAAGLLGERLRHRYALAVEGGAEVPLPVPEGAGPE